MNRRQFVQTSVAATVATTVDASALAPKPKKRPNILYVFSDQHRECAMPGKPHSPVVAPNIDAFRQGNFEMANCISNYPLCSPYRAILQSGRWPHQSGVTTNGKVLPPAPTNLGSMFQSAGYHTVYVGKWHLDQADNHFIPAGPMRMGYEDWQMWCMTNNHYHAWTYDQTTGQRINPDGWQPLPMSTEAIDRLKNMPKGPDAKPFFMIVSWNPPHPPFNPPPEDEKPYPPEQIPFRPNIKLAADVKGGKGKVNAKLQSMDTLREAAQGYYGGVTGVDQYFARILKALDDLGLAEDTIVVYTSDHGEMLGGHAHMGKEVPFEESCHVPFYIRVPGKTKTGGSSKELFAAIDIHPTLLGLAGIPVPATAGGRDMSAVILGTGSAPATDGVMLMCDAGEKEEGESACPTYRGIRTDTHTYAVAEDGRWVLYDNEKDPFQMTNLISDPAHRDLMDKLDHAILAWQKKCGDTFDLKAAIGKTSQDIS